MFPSSACYFRTFWAITLYAWWSKNIWWWFWCDKWWTAKRAIRCRCISSITYKWKRDDKGKQRGKDKSCGMLVIRVAGCSVCLCLSAYVMCQRQLWLLDHHLQREYDNCTRDFGSVYLIWKLVIAHGWP